MESERIRVAILEDQQVFREALVAVLEGAGMEVVAGCAEPAPFFARVRETLPHVALVDLRLELPEREAPTCGMSALRRLRDFFPAVKPLVLSGHREQEVVEQCLQAGAAGYLWKQNVGCAEVVEAVERVGRGERLLSVGMSPPRPETSSRGALDLLTPREREVLGFIAAGADNLRIATRLRITERTVKAHITSIYKKLGSENRAQLAVLGCQLGVQRPAYL